MVSEHEKKLKKIYNDYIRKTGKIARPVQEALTVDIADNLFNAAIGLAESRTGTGKTLAYLLAAAFFIKHGPDSQHRRRVTIATPQKTLQEAIMTTFAELRDTVPEFKNITIANIKGKRNYVSKTRIPLLDERADAYCVIHRGDKAYAARIREHIENLKNCIEACGGDLDLIEKDETIAQLESEGFFTDTSLRELIALGDEEPVKDTVDAGKDGKKKKGKGIEPDPEATYHQAARARSIEADIVVTNHTLLLISGKLVMLTGKEEMALVPMQNLIIDEGHALVRAARDVWHQKVTISHIIDYLQRLAIETDKAKYSKARMDAYAVDGLRRKLVKIRDTFRKSVRENYKDSPEAGEKERRLDIPMILVQNDAGDQVSIGVKEFTRKVGDILDQVDGVFAKRKKLTEEQTKHQKELKRYAGIVKSFNEVFKDAMENAGGYGYYVSFSPVHAEPSIGRLPWDIARRLQKTLWDRNQSVSLLSGTLADMESYDAKKDSSTTGNYFGDATFRTISYLLGLDENYITSKSKHLEGYSYKPPFGWKNVAVHLYGPTVIPPFHEPAPPPADPDDQDHKKRPASEFDAETRARVKQSIALAAAEQMGKVLYGRSNCKKGGAMVLAPSYEDLELLDAALFLQSEKRKALGQRVCTVLKQEQGSGISLNTLIKQFVEGGSEDKILLSVGGWEGIDLPGNQLTRLFIIRVPHASPEDPVFRLTTRRRVMYVKKKEEEFWRFRQGLGRLLRKEEDEGEIHIFDSRLMEENDHTHKIYRAFLEGEFKGKIQYHPAAVTEEKSGEASVRPKTRKKNRAGATLGV